MENTAKNTFGFRFVAIDIVHKAVAPRPVDLQGVAFNFDVITESSVQKDNRLVLIFVRINVSEVNKAQLLASFTVVSFFEITNFEEAVILNDNGMFTIDNDLELYLKSAAISTSRGIVWQELKGSYLHNAVLPVIDVRTLKNVSERQIISDKGELLQKELQIQ